MKEASGSTMRSVSFFTTVSVVACLSVGRVDAFVVSPQCPAVSTSTSTTLYGRARRGGLGKVASETGVTPSKVRTSSSSSRRTKKGKASTKKGDAAISPALAEWMASQENGGENAPVSTPEPIEEKLESVTDVAATFEAFTAEEESSSKNKSKKNSRRIKQSERMELESQRKSQVQIAVKSIESALEESGNLEGILDSIRTLVSLPSESVRTIFASPKRTNYRLAWVGSDDAISHIGTGLHKVPLARLQEVFLSAMGKNRIELLEVIRVLGPFPNVKNILQGDTKIDRSGDDVSTLQITYDSMVDGTGKEIMAGTDDNIRRAGLQVYFSDEQVLVAAVPPEDGKVRSNLLEDGGKNVLVFIQEPELDEKLDALRVL